MYNQEIFSISLLDILNNRLYHISTNESRDVNDVSIGIAIL